MSKGLFKSHFERDALYKALYSKQGASPPTKRMDIRLGGWLGQEEDEEEEEVEVAEVSTPNPVAPKKEPIFAKEVKGFPMWLVGVFLLGFAWAVRQNRPKK